MAETRFPRVEQQRGTKIRNVPIAVTPEGFWCCPSPAAALQQKPLKPQSSTNKPKQRPSSPPPHTKPSSSHKKQHSSHSEKKSAQHHRTKPISSDDEKGDSPTPPVSERHPRSKPETLPRKVTIEFGEPGTSNVKLVLLGKHGGFSVKLNVHKEILAENSTFFAKKLSCKAEEGPCSGTDTTLCIIEIEGCEDVEIYVETLGLLYCKDMKRRLAKQSVQRVLRILKVAESIGFSSCVQSCLDYLEAVPWVGEEEEDKVVSSVLSLQKTEAISVNPILKRVSPTTSTSIPSPKDTLSHIIGLVLISTEDRSRREMKSVVLKLLKEINTTSASSALSSLGSQKTASDDSVPYLYCYETIYSCCKTCLDTLLLKFKQAVSSSEPDLIARFSDPLVKQISLEADNILWLVDILADPRSSADEFVSIWADQHELAALHSKLPSMIRYHVSCVTARLFVGIGRGEMLPEKETRHMLLQTWLDPLIDDYSWLSRGGSRGWFDKAVVEEGIGRTVLTLDLEDQQSVLLGWMGRYLKNGDSNCCLDLSRAFEVWWRRVFVRPYGDQLIGMKERGNVGSG